MFVPYGNVASGGHGSLAGRLFAPTAAVAVLLGFGAAAGYAASLPLQDRPIRNTGDAISGQVLDLHMNGMMPRQAIEALIAGAVASFVPPAVAMGTMAAASTVVTLPLVPRRSPRRRYGRLGTLLGTPGRP